MVPKLCTGQAATLVASGGPSGSYYSWYDANFTLLQSSASNTYGTSALSASTRYYVNFSIAAPPYCTSDFVPVDVQVGPPAAPTATGRVGCPGAQLSLSAAGLPTGGSYRWYNEAGTLLQESTSATFVTPALSATTTYSVAIFKGCESARTPVVATITSVPAPVTTSINSCGPGTITLQAMSQLSAAEYSHRWYATSTGDSPITGIVSNNPQVYPFISTYTADFSTTTSYYVATYSSLTGCESARTQVTATIQPNTAFSAPSYRLCSAGKAYLSVSGAPAGSSITWKDAAGNQVSTASTYTTTHLTTSTFYKVTVTVPGVCATTKQVDVTVSNTSGSPVVTSTQVCRGQRAPLTVSGAPAGAYLHWYDNATTYVPRVVSPTTTFLTDELTANRVYYVAYITVNNPSCTSDRIAVTALVLPNPPGLPTTTAATYAFADNDDYTVTATPGANGNVCRWYETATGGVPFEGLSYNPSSECLLSKNVYVSTYNSTTGCEGDRKMITLTVGPNFCKNLVRTWQVQKSGVTDETTIETLPVSDALQTSQYFDGLGRLVQEVAKQQSPEPLKRDLITSVDYDAMGRESKKYLPYTSGTDGFYKRNAISEQAAFYTAASDNIIDDDAPYSTVLYEASPLNRVLKQGNPGTIWQPNNSPYTAPTDRSQKANFEAGLDNEVLLWTYTPPTASYPLGLVNASTGAAPLYYMATQLAKNKTKDEHQNEVIDYQDKEGKTILRKVQAGASDWVETYYIHDDFGRLVAVIPPEAVQLIRKSTSDYFNQSDATKEAFLKKWAFRYKYDARNRLVEKQLPGADFIAMVYDNRDRVVLMQDGNQRANAKNEWSYTKYDALNRAVITGIYRPGVLSRTTLQTNVDNLTDNQGTKVGYQNADVTLTEDGAFPSLTTEVLSITYYDSYSACSFCDPTNTSNPQRFQSETWVTTGAEAFERSVNTRGLVVATSVKVLGEDTWLKTVNYYDYLLYMTKLTCKWWTKKRGLPLGFRHLNKQASKMNESFVVKIKQLLATCQTVSFPALHLSRQKFIVHFLFAMIEARQVQFPEIAAHFSSSASLTSRLRGSPPGRIQRFFADFLLEDAWLAHLIMNWLPTGKLTLCLDRTNWQFGSLDINILALTAAYRGVGVPVFFCLLSKKGNSTTVERVDLLQRFLDAFGKERIGCLIADRDGVARRFIGGKWYDFLLQSQIPFFIRLPKHHYFNINGVELKAEQLLQQRNKCFLDNVLISGCYLSVAIKRLPDEYLIVLTNTFAHQALSTYRQRWTIETFFQSIKKRGFQLETTHLQDLDRLHKLIALVTLAFTCCLVVGL